MPARIRLPLDVLVPYVPLLTISDVEHYIKILDASIKNRAGSIESSPVTSSPVTSSAVSSLPVTSSPILGSSIKGLSISPWEMSSKGLLKSKTESKSKTIAKLKAIPKLKIVLKPEIISKLETCLPLKEFIPEVIEPEVIEPEVFVPRQSEIGEADLEVFLQSSLKNITSTNIKRFSEKDFVFKKSVPFILIKSPFILDSNKYELKGLFSSSTRTLVVTSFSELLDFEFCDSFLSLSLHDRIVDLINKELFLQSVKDELKVKTN